MRIPWNKGLNKYTDERIKKYAETLQRKYVDGTFIGHEGKKHSDESKDRIRISVTGNKNNLGKKWSKETKEKMSIAAKGRPSPRKNKKLPKSHAENIKMAVNKPEVLKLKRIHRIKSIEKNYGKCFPNYNEEACEWFKNFDKTNNTQGRYAVYGGGEFLIEELGYWVDYINFDKKLIIEWDLDSHHNRESSKTRDEIRQKEIMSIYSDYEFIRINTREKAENETNRSFR